MGQWSYFAWPRRNRSITLAAAAIAATLCLMTPAWAASTARLTVQSTPVTGIAITGWPSSALGTTNYNKDIQKNSYVTLTAPATFGGYVFLKWTVNTNPQTLVYTTTVDFTMGSSNKTAVATYATARTLNVQSSPITGVAITGTAPGTTNYSLTLADGASVSLIAPAPVVKAGITYNFIHWTLDGSVYSNPLLVTINGGNRTAIAVYAIATHRLDVTSTPVDGVTITGTSPGAANYAATLDEGSTVSLTAPAMVTTGGKTYDFVAWTGQALGQTTISFVLMADTVCNAEYVERAQAAIIAGMAIVSETRGHCALLADIERDSSGTLIRDMVRLSRVKPRQLIIGTNITSLNVNGNVATIEGICKLNNTPDCPYVLTITFGSPGSDHYHIQVYRSGTLTVDVSGAVSLGNLNLTQP